ncbi:nucleoside 2-deoxyribosyltransferase [Leuconostoc carnosum]|nr:nucleoside 2-deoxyribosyltransferase [Leuconostoc carnosum]KAA8366918.1 nucleoside 2-deoxyribosyltransferase [Leuconostoc carnosum]
MLLQMLFFIWKLGGIFLNERVFLAAPFKQLLNQKNVVDSENTQVLQTIIQLLENKHFIVDNAHKRENWGAEMMTPSQCTTADYFAIKQCQYFIAFPGNPASPGTHIELGWASAFNKKMILLLKVGVDYAYLVKGLGAIADVEYLYYQDLADCVQKINQFFK